MNRNKNKRIIWCLMLLLGGVFLTGCSAKELESRRFPLVLELDVKEDAILFGCAWPTVKDDGGKQTTTEMMEGGTEPEKESENLNGNQLVNNEKITRVTGMTLAEAIENVQSLQDKYVDYSQVKAVIWGKGLVKNERLQKEVLEWLEDSPFFARNILIFQGKTKDLSLETIQEHAQGQPGAYLENLYKNNEKFQEYTVTLREFLYGNVEQR